MSAPNEITGFSDSEYDAVLEMAKTIQRGRNISYGDAWKTMDFEQIMSIVDVKVKRVFKLEQQIAFAKTEDVKPKNLYRVQVDNALDLINYFAFLVANLVRKRGIPKDKGEE